MEGWSTAAASPDHALRGASHDSGRSGFRRAVAATKSAAQLATATSRNLFVLTVVTTVLLPPAFVTGFFGMSTKGLPFGDSDNGTLYAAAFCCLAAGLVYLLIRRYRMLS